MGADTILIFGLGVFGMKPHFEHVTVKPGESWALLWRELPAFPFLWHYHAEFELTLTMNAQGQRYVGDSLEDFESGDLVLVGANQPHTWAASHRPDPGQPMLAVVVWFTADWLARWTQGWSELVPLAVLAQDAGRGMRFSAQTRSAVQPLMLSLRNLDAAQRLPVLLQVLILLARDERVVLLSSHALSPSGAADDKAQGRIARVLAQLHRDPTTTPTAQELADDASLSLGAFHRFFKRHTGLTVLDYLAQLRIGLACEALIQSDRPIKLIAMETGYGALAHFNRQFLDRKGMTPKAFRAQYRRAGGHQAD